MPNNYKKEQTPLTDDAIKGIIADRKYKEFQKQRVMLRSINKKEVSIKETKLTVLLQLSCNKRKGDKTRPGIDLVTVLDVSSSMDGVKIKKMKGALKFLINKLSPADRLSIVTYSKEAQNKCALTCMTDDAKDGYMKIVDNLKVGRMTNMAAGLQLGLEVVQTRKFSDGRMVAIMLMSDGDQTEGEGYGDAQDVNPIENVPVYTFGFGHGANYDSKVLNEVARKSKATYSFVEDNESSNNLSKAFASCLGGLLSVVAQDLKLGIKKLQTGMTIKKVSAGSYPLSGDLTTKTITFGYLYDREIRNVLIDLELPKTPSVEPGYKTLEITCSYNYMDGNKSSPVELSPQTINVFRTTEKIDEKNEEVSYEQKRKETVEGIQKAKDLADKSTFNEAQKKLKEIQSSLDSVKLNAGIKPLKSEVNQLFDVMANEKIYKAKGRHIAPAILTSHALQQAATLGDGKPSIFATPAMAAILGQAINFDKNPNKPIPDVVFPEDNKPTLPAEIAKPLAKHIGEASKAIGAVQKSLLAIQELLENSSKN